MELKEKFPTLPHGEHYRTTKVKLLPVAFSSGDSTHTAVISSTPPGREGPSGHFGLRSSISKINQPKQYFPLLPYRITLFTEAKPFKTSERNSGHSEIRWLGHKPDLRQLCLRSFL